MGFFYCLLRKIIIFLTLKDNPQINRHAQTIVIVKEKLKNTQVLWNLSVFTQNEGVKWSDSPLIWSTDTVNNLNVIKKVLKKIDKNKNMQCTNTETKIWATQMPIWHQYISSLELRYSRRVSSSKGKLGCYMYIQRLRCKPNHPVITVLHTNTFLWSLIKKKMRNNYFLNAKTNPVL